MFNPVPKQNKQGVHSRFPRAENTQRASSSPPRETFLRSRPAPLQVRQQSPDCPEIPGRPVSHHRFVLWQASLLPSRNGTGKQGSEGSPPPAKHPPRAAFDGAGQHRFRFRFPPQQQVFMPQRSADGPRWCSIQNPVFHTSAAALPIPAPAEYHQSLPLSGLALYPPEGF